MYPSHTYAGVVRRGKRRGSALGYPTVNISLPHKEVDGIYAAIVRVEGKEYPAAAFADPKRGILEAHLLDFSADLYGREISIELVKKMRDRAAFTSDENLKAAISEDVYSVREYLQSRE